MVSARFFMLISLPVPILMWQLRISFLSCFRSSKSTFSIIKTQASAISSLHRNSRMGCPVPQSSMCVEKMPCLLNAFTISSVVLISLMLSNGLLLRSFLTDSQSPSCRHLPRCIFRIMAGST